MFQVKLKETIFFFTLKILFVEKNKKSRHFETSTFQKKKDSSVTHLSSFFFSRMWSEVFQPLMDRPTMILDSKDHPEWEVPSTCQNKTGKDRDRWRVKVGKIRPV